MIPLCSHKLNHVDDVNCVPLSEMIFSGKPKREIQLMIKALQTVSVVMSGNGRAIQVNSTNITFYLSTIT